MKKFFIIFSIIIATIVFFVIIQSKLFNKNTETSDLISDIKQQQESNSDLQKKNIYKSEESICSRLSSKYDFSSCVIPGGLPSGIEANCLEDDRDLSESRNVEGVFRKIYTDSYISFKDGQACECAGSGGKRKGALTEGKISWTEVQSNFSIPYSSSSEIINLWINKTWQAYLLVDIGKNQCPSEVQLVPTTEMSHEDICSCASFTKM